MSSIALFTDRYRYFLYAGATDMRKSFAGLCGIVINIMQLSIMDTDIFIFLNKDKTHMKILLHEDNGFTMFYRKLDRGRFTLPDSSQDDSGPLLINANELLAIIKGLSFHKYQRYLS